MKGMEPANGFLLLKGMIDKTKEGGRVTSKRDEDRSMKMMKQYEARKVLLPQLVGCLFHAVVVAVGLG